MAREEQQPMSDARLREIEKRWREREYGQMDISGRHRIASASGAWNYWITNAAADEGELLAEVERLRAREAAWVAQHEQAMLVVRTVAEATEDWEREANHSWLYFDDAHAASDLQDLARALLASDSADEAK